MKNNSTGIGAEMKIDKRKLNVGMRIDVTHREVRRLGCAWVSSGKTLFITKLEKTFGNDVFGNRVHQQTICWDGDGNYVIFYHHFEENLKLVA